MNFGLNSVAMMAPGGSGGQSEQSPVFMLGWLAMMLFVFYFLMIRPQQRREKERRAMMDGIKSGDRVAFAGGFIGIVTNVKERTLIIRIAENVKVEVARTSVSQVLAKDEDPDSATRA
ncbi:MAG: preprotein translocase subunit YajC [Kiritimatiellae bacterium]|nr:preprotein translocase subunit YajC [Kiritimatiellia bacterium]